MNQKTDIFNYIKLLGAENIKTRELEVQLVVMNKDFELYRATTKDGMKSDLVKNFLQPIARLVTFGPDKGLQLMDYDPQTKPDHDVIWTLGTDDVPAFQAVQQQLERPFDELGIYEDESGDMEGVTAMALRVQSEYGDIVIFQRIMPNYILRKSRKLSVFFDGAAFGKLDSPAAFQISSNNHVFYWDAKLYVIDQTHFEYIFDYQDEKINIADKKLMEIAVKYAGSIEIAKGKTLEGLLEGDKHAINKLQQLDSTVTLDTKALTKIKLEYDKDIKINAKTGKMIIEEKSDVKELINILNDDYLLSDFTTGRYAVHSKKKIQPKKSVIKAA